MSTRPHRTTIAMLVLAALACVAIPAQAANAGVIVQDSTGRAGQEAAHFPPGPCAR